MAKKKLALEDILVPVEEIPYEVPENWCWVNLNYVITTLETGKRPKGGVAGINEGIPSLGGEHLRYDGGFNLDKVKYVPNEFVEQMKKGIIENNDILIVKDGATTGKTSFVDENFPFGKAVINEHVFKCRANEIVLLPKYLYRFISSPVGQEFIKNNLKGSAQGGINTKFVENYIIPIPPLAEQERIVNRIESLFDKIDKAAELVDEARDGFEKRRSAILESAFSGELTKKWREENLNVECSSDLIDRIQEERKIRYKEEVKKAKEEGRRPRYNKPLYLDETNLEESRDLKKLPDIWKYTYIGNISEIVRGGSPRPSGDPKYFGGDIPWITVAELTKDEDVYLNNTKQTLTELGRTKSRFIDTGTLLLTNSGATLGVPKVSNISGCINDGILSFADIPFVDKFYMYYYLKSQTKRFRNLDQGAAQPNLNTTIVNNWVIPLAPLEEQKEIVKVLEKCLKNEIEVDTISNINENIDVIKKSILAKAFRGELGSNDLNEESSLELLKEIIK